MYPPSKCLLQVLHLLLIKLLSIPVFRAASLAEAKILIKAPFSDNCITGFGAVLVSFSILAPIRLLFAEPYF